MVEIVVDRVPQVEPEAEWVRMPLLLAQEEEVAHKLPDLLTLGDVEVEKEVLGDFVPLLESETRVLKEGDGEVD